MTMPQRAPGPALRRAPPIQSNSPPQLSERTFRSLTALVRTSCGIALAPSKRLMLQTRLARRVKASGLDSFEDYCALLTSGRAPAAEMQAFVDCVVTNETSFFREPPHFEYLSTARLNALAASGGRPGHLAMWSAACSTGEEVWTMAMVAEAAATAPGGAPGWSWSALATDISIKALSEARRGVYAMRDLARVPPAMTERFVQRGRDGAAETAAIAPTLRRNVRFGQVNLMHDRYLPGAMMDVIFCRNVLIYFEGEVQTRIVNKLCAHLRPGGLLILGHSDMSRERQAPLRLLRNNIHERLEG